MDDENERSKTDWTNVALPVFAVTVFLLVFLVICQYFISPFKKRCCPQASRSRNQVRGADNGGTDNGGFTPRIEDLPPSYSVLGYRRDSVYSFQVVAEDQISITSLREISTICEKLPSYQEILNAQERKLNSFTSGTGHMQETSTNLEDMILPNSVTPTEQNDDQSSVYTCTPPPYRPASATQTPELFTNNPVG